MDLKHYARGYINMIKLAKSDIPDEEQPLFYEVSDQDLNNLENQVSEINRHQYERDKGPFWKSIYHSMAEDLHVRKLENAKKRLAHNVAVNRGNAVDYWRSNLERRLDPSKKYIRLAPEIAMHGNYKQRRDNAMSALQDQAIIAYLINELRNKRLGVVTG